MELILLGVCLFILIFNVIVSFARGMRKSLLRLLTVALAAVLAFVLARLLSVKIAEWLLPMMRGALSSDPTFAPFFNGEIAVDEAIAVLAEMLVAPILFLLLYIVLKAIFLIPYAILKGLTSFLRFGDKNIFSRLLGGAVGVATAAIGIVVFVTPVFGYLDIASHAIEVASQNVSAVSEVAARADSAQTDMSDAETASDVIEMLNNDQIKPALATPVLSNIYGGLGSKLFEDLTTEEWDGETIHLKSELETFTDIAANIRVLGSSGISAYGDEQCAAVETLAAEVGDSPLLSSIFSGVISAASKHWMAGETFLGAPRPELGTNGDLIFNAFLSVFSTSEQETVEDDLDFFSDVFALSVKYDLILALADETMDDAELSVVIQNSGFYSDTQLLLAEHPRMQPVGDAFVDVGMRTLIKEMGLPEDYRESCGALLDDMTGVLQGTPTKEDGSLDEETLAADLAEVLVKNDIAVNESAVKLVASGVADHFTAEELSTLSTTEVIDKLIERFDAVDLAGLVASGTLPETPAA